MCGQDSEVKYMLSMFMNEQRQSKINSSYATAAPQIRTYAPTQIQFSRPLGINYGNIGLTTPLSSYLGNTITNYNPIQQTMQPKINSQFDNQRNSLFNELYKLRFSNYERNQGVRNVQYN